MRPKVIAFDCFGTIFDMAPVPRAAISAHLFMGGLFVAWWLQRLSWQWRLFWLLNAVEVATAVWRLSWSTRSRSGY